MSDEFYLAHLRPNLSRLLPWAQRLGLIPDRGQGDLGYAMHAALRSAFAELAPEPFSYRHGQGLLAYTSQAPAMHAAAALAEPEVASMLGLDATAQSSGLLTRPFPQHWSAGQRLSFEVRVRPIIRKEGKEMDAFLSAALRQPDEVLSRQAIYAHWLQRQFGSIAELHDIQMTEFKLSAVLRQAVSNTQEKRIKQMVLGPDVVLTGVLQVQQGPSFGDLLARGIGRHRAFGFGMLLLKPLATLRG